MIALHAAANAVLALAYLGAALAVWRFRGRAAAERRRIMPVLIGFALLGGLAHLAHAVTRHDGVHAVEILLEAAMAAAGVGAAVALWLFLSQKRGNVVAHGPEPASLPVQAVVPESDNSAELIAANERLEREIRERRQVQDNLHRAIEEREALLREVHHRVKNNLQLVTSLLNLQMRGETSESLRQKLREAQTRINVLSVIHNKLYAGADLAAVDLAGLLPDLCVQLTRAYSVKPETVRLEVEAASIRANMDHAIPIALLTSEAVTNALKYAFPDGRSGTIHVQLREADSSVVLRIADDGVGFDSQPDGEARTGALGMTLIRGMARQLDGALEMRTEEGVEITVTMARDSLVVKPALSRTA